MAKKKLQKSLLNSSHISQWVAVALVILLFISCVFNLMQGIKLSTIIQEKQTNSTALNNYRELQKRQISFVKSNCESGAKKYGDSGLNDTSFKGMMALAYHAMSSNIVYTNMDPEDLFKDLLFEYLTTTCYKPRLLLLGIKDISDLNLHIYSETTNFTFDESELDKVKW